MPRYWGLDFFSPDSFPAKVGWLTSPICFLSRINHSFVRRRKGKLVFCRIEISRDFRSLIRSFQAPCLRFQLTWEIKPIVVSPPLNKNTA